MSPEYTEMIAAIAFGILSAIFISAFVILIIICKRQKLLYKGNYFDAQSETSRPEKQLIEPDKPELELGQVNPNLEGVLYNDQWVDDASGLIPHCLSILKTCRCLTERLTTLAMSSVPMSGHYTNFVESARRISSRVDDMVKSMYPPLDARLLEARAEALTLAVTHLALIAKYECGRKERGGFNWIDRALSDMEGHISFLRQAASIQESISKNQNVLYLNTVM
ncbi:unnamed protein product [Brassicogethes aeneus]|uniref:Transmembrane protein 98 n=1 Tax=Brassicogethes aeneus TaxID=1431903 RepID=A0A9P0B7V0_BRAAE|nr:unnamed protein product [Brassicogethes aeneus]